MRWLPRQPLSWQGQALDAGRRLCDLREEREAGLRSLRDPFLAGTGQAEERESWAWAVNSTA